MQHVIGIVVVILVISGIVYITWGPRGEVLMERAEDQINKIIGEAQILRKEIEADLDKIKDGIERTRDVAIRLEGSSRRVAERIENLEQERNGLAEALSKLADLIDAGEPVTLKGKVYNVTDLRAMAQKEMKRFQMLGDIVPKHRAEKEYTDAVAAEYRAQMVDDRHRIEALEMELFVIDNQIAVMEAQKRTSRVAGTMDGSQDDNFKIVEAKFRELQDKVGAKRQVWNERMAERKGRIEDLLADPELPDADDIRRTIGHE